MASAFFWEDKKTHTSLGEAAAFVQIKPAGKGHM